MKKVIFITISRGGTARDILQNEFFDLVRKYFDRIVIFTTAYEDGRFRKEFGGTNIFFENMYPQKYSLPYRLLRSFYTYIIYNQTTARTSRFGAAGQEVPRWYVFKYWVYKAIFLPLSKITFPKRAVQWFDQRFLQKDMVGYYKSMIERYRPSVIFCSSIFEDEDIGLVKAGKKKNIPVVGMPKTWDNTSKAYFRAKVDCAPVWGAFMEEQMIMYQQYRKDEIHRVGVPKFDYYVDRSRLLSREEFCELYGLNPKKKIIFFGSEGKISKGDPDILDMLRKAIGKGDIPVDVQILVRPHFAYRGDMDKFTDFEGLPGIVVDRMCSPSKGFKDAWDYSKGQMDRFMNSIYHSDIVINTHSSLTLDAAAFDKPIIIIMFDGYEEKPWHQSIARWYTTDYYSKILSFRPGKTVYSEEEIISAVNTYLIHPGEDSDARSTMLEFFCGKIDGGAGRRIFDIVKRKSESYVYETQN